MSIGIGPMFEFGQGLTQHLIHGCRDFFGNTSVGIHTTTQANIALKMDFWRRIQPQDTTPMMRSGDAS